MKKQKLKPKKITSLLFLLITTLFLNSCDLFNDDDTPELPPITQNGANTFGFKVNGEIVIVTNTSNLTAIYHGGILQLGGGERNDNKEIRIQIILKNNLEEGKNYPFTNSSFYQAEFIDFENLNNCDYNYEDTYEGSITFSKIDKINYIISGTFNLSTKKPDCEDIKITEGRFDLKYIP
ncbi:hypothetical protein [Polaribacter sp.]|uniref:hypothetical protein n=1 Tax=Polaribacter sp. TaxID=1920175 RepID=UPI003F6CF9B4